MVSTRSSAKRKSMDNPPEAAEPQTLPASTPKRQRLPLRKKTAKSPRSEITDTDNDALSVEDEGSTAADETLDLDAALQAQVAAQNPDTPVLPAAEARWEAAAKEDEEESDDEAPEAVSNVQAASRAQEAADAMRKAARDEANKLRQKRKDRDARLKEQADLRKANEPFPQPASAPDTAAPEETSLDDKPTQVAPASIKLDGALLPDEFLASDSEEERPDGPAPKRRKANKQKQKASEPRDKRVGGTVYRVMKGTDSRVAPKAESRSKLVRSNLIQRGREGKKKGGFLAGPQRLDWGTSRKC